MKGNDFMRFYYVYYTTEYEGQAIKTYCGEHMCNNPKNEVIEVTWDNLEKVYKKYGLVASFHYYNKKKGRVIEFFNKFLYLKEWKHPNINIKIKVEYEEANPSLKKILNYHDGEAAIKYLVERGINII